MTSKTPKHTSNKIQTQVSKKTGGVKEVTSAFKEKVEDRLSNAYESKESLEVLGENFVESRVYLLRHYPYIEDDNYKEYIPLLKKVQDGEVLSKEDLKKFQDLEKKIRIYDNLDDIPDKIANTIKNIFNDNVQLFYCTNGKERVKITGNNLKDYYNIKDYGEIDLKGSDKSKQSGKCQLEMAEQIGKEIEKALKQVQGNIKNIVIVSNRSYANSFNILGGERDIGISGSEQIFEENGYMYIDYSKDKKIIKPKATTLQVTPQNYFKLKSLFPDIPHNSIIDFQNKLNIHFIQNQELFEECISKDNTDLQIFCLVNLLKKSKFDVIHKNRILLNKPQIKQAIIQANPKYEIIVNYYENVYPNVSEVRSKSLDKRIKEGEDIKPFFTLSNEEYQDERGGLSELKIITEGKPIKYIQGNAGNGKSFLLTQIAEKIHKYNTENINTLKVLYNCNYINLSGGGLDRLNNIEFKTEYINVILIDSIDESGISGDKRKELDSRLLELSKNFKIIITSRNGYLYEYEKDEERKKTQEQKQSLDNNQEVIELKDFNEKQIDDYLNTYFGEDEKKISKAEQILFKLSGAGNNPLILYMVCEIVEDGGIKDKEIKNITIIDIYNKIIESRLKNWNGKVELRKIEKDKYLKNILDGLQEISYEEIINNKKIKKEDFEEFIFMNTDELLNQAIQGINLVFRKNEDNQEYDFIHQSFKEYFAAKYVFEEMKEDIEKNSNNFNFENFLCQDVKKVDLFFLDFLCEFLNSDLTIKEKFLHEVIKNENYFSPSVHHKIVYILGILDENSRKKYLMKIKINENIIDVIGVLMKKGYNELENFLMLDDISRGYLGDFDEEIRFICLETLCKYLSIENIILNSGKYIELIDAFYFDSKKDISKKSISNKGIRCLELIKTIGGEDAIMLVEKIRTNCNFDSNINLKCLEILRDIGGYDITGEIKKILINTKYESNKIQCLILLEKIKSEDIISFVRENIERIKYCQNNNMEMELHFRIKNILGEYYIYFFREKFKRMDDSFYKIEYLRILEYIGDKNLIQFIEQNSDFILFLFKSGFHDYHLFKELLKILKNIGGTKIIKIIYNNLEDKDKINYLSQLMDIGGDEYNNFIRDNSNYLKYYFTNSNTYRGLILFDKIECLKILFKVGGDENNKFIIDNIEFVMKNSKDELGLLSILENIPLNKELSKQLSNQIKKYYINIDNIQFSGVYKNKYLDILFIIGGEDNIGFIKEISYKDLDLVSTWLFSKTSNLHSGLLDLGKIQIKEKLLLFLDSIKKIHFCLDYEIHHGTLFLFLIALELFLERDSQEYITDIIKEIFLNTKGERICDKKNKLLCLNILRAVGGKKNIDFINQNDNPTFLEF